MNRSNSLDCLYNKVYGEIIFYLLEHAADERVKKRIKFAKDEICYEATIDRQGSLLQLMSLEDTKYDILARTWAELSLLVGGALEVLSRSSSNAVAANINKQVIEEALHIYADGAITPDGIIITLENAYREFEKITGETTIDFVNLFSSAYNSAKQECGIEVPQERPEYFLMKTCLKQRLPKEVLEIEKAFLNTDHKEWIKKVTEGDVSDYTIAVVPTISMRRISGPIYNDSEIFIEEMIQNAKNIGELTKLPLTETLENEKMTFANTFEYKILSEKEIRQTITLGLNKYLKMLEQYHKQRINNFSSLYGDDIETYGCNGCLFGDRVGENYIILNNSIVGWDGGGQGDSNSWYLPIKFLEKVNALYLDEYIGPDGLEMKWLSNAVNEYIIVSTEYFGNKLESAKCDNENMYNWIVTVSGNHLKKLKQISKIGDMLVDDVSRIRLEKFEKMVDD